MTSPRPRAPGGSPCSGTCASWAPTRPRFHEEVGRYARERGVELLVAVGPLSRAYAADHHLAGRGGGRRAGPRAAAATGDTLLVKGSRGVGLEAVAEALA